MSKLVEWLKWRIAFFLDLFPDTCWSTLVMWVISDGYCIQELTRQSCDDAYCGKCAFNGRLDLPDIREGWQSRRMFRMRFKPFADFYCNHLCNKCSEDMKLVFQGKAEIRFK